MRSFSWWCCAIALALLLVSLVALLSGWIFWLLWNWLIPGIFHGPEITYWQAVGLMFLLWFLKGCYVARDKGRNYID